MVAYDIYNASLKYKMKDANYTGEIATYKK